jgi:hypothetical protein
MRDRLLSGMRGTATTRLAAAALALLLLGVLAGPATAAPAEPPIGVSKSKLAASLHCPIKIAGKKVPVMVVTGTGYTGAEAYAIGKGALEKYGHPTCYVDFPFRTTGDIQVASEYLVYGIRTMARRAHRQIAVFGISQGGLLPRWALTYWPSLRPLVSDVLAAAGTQHGTVLGGECSVSSPCTPANWQQRAGSNLLNAINRQPDESPGPTSWTTVRSSTDETVQPQTGKHPTSALQGATNILIQKVCPGRQTTHIGTALDSVTFAAFVDAVDHAGPAKVSRLPKDVCDHPLAPGLDDGSSSARVGVFASDPQVEAPKVGKEPPVKAYARRIAGR